MMSRQLPETLLWTRKEFWGQPTGFVGKDGTGPVVVVGHTPSIVLSRYADRMANEGVNEDGRGIVVPVGACDATGGVADRIDIDCSAAAGAPRGRVGLVASMRSCLVRHHQRRGMGRLRAATAMLLHIGRRAMTRGYDENGFRSLRMARRILRYSRTSSTSKKVIDAR